MASTQRHLGALVLAGTALGSACTDDAGLTTPRGAPDALRVSRAAAHGGAPTVPGGPPPGATTFVPSPEQAARFLARLGHVPRRWGVAEMFASDGKGHLRSRGPVGRWARVGTLTSSALTGFGGESVSSACLVDDGSCDPSSPPPAPDPQNPPVPPPPPPGYDASPAVITRAVTNVQEPGYGGDPDAYIEGVTEYSGFLAVAGNTVSYAYSGVADGGDSFPEQVGWGDPICAAGPVNCFEWSYKTRPRIQTPPCGIAITGHTLHRAWKQLAVSPYTVSAWGYADPVRTEDARQSAACEQTTEPRFVGGGLTDDGETWCMYRIWYWTRTGNIILMYPLYCWTQ